MTKEEREKAIAKIKDIQNDLGCFGLNDKFYNDEEKEQINALNVALEALEQEPCETIKEIPKDYKYDTETKDFLVYRHIYTGNEIHIEKPVPRYRLEQEPCGDAISRAELMEWLENIQPKDGKELGVLFDVREYVKKMPPVTPIRKCQNDGGWYGSSYWAGIYRCSKRGYKEESTLDSCPNCGADMRKEQNNV